MNRSTGVVFLDMPGQFASALAATESATTDAGRELVVTFIENFRAPALLRFLSESRPVLFTGVFRGQLILGPLQVRGRSACVSCLQYWTRATDSNGSALPTDLSPGLQLLAGVTRDAIAEFERKGTVAELERSFQSIDCQTFKRKLHPVVSLRNCEFCRPIDRGGIRMHCSPMTGIVNRLIRTSHPIAGVYHAYSSFIDPPGCDSSGASDTSNNSWGRGLTAEEAENSCIGEAVEAYSLKHRGEEPVVRARLSEISGVDPREILLISERQYEQRDYSNVRSARHHIPEPYCAGDPIDWLPGTDLIGGGRAWVPAACCLTSYRFREGEAKYARADASGCASGGSQTEATLAALHECIERDALAIWWYTRSKRPEVPLNSTGDKLLRFMQSGLRDLGRNLTVLDITTDLQVPAYVGITADVDGGRPVIASAAHLSPKIALLRTVTESVLNWFISSKNPRDIDIRVWLQSATLQQHPHLQSWGAIRLPQEVPEMSTESQVEYLTSRLAMAGLRPVAVDLTRRDTLLNTVRVIVPGLRTFRPRYSTGRLYDVPVSLGWRPDRLPESELNPWCVF